MLSLLSLLSPSIDPQYFWPIAFLGLGFPYLVILNILFLAAWFFIKSKRMWMSAICMLLLSFQLGGILQFNFQDAEKTITDIHCLTYNIHNAKSAYSRNKEEKATKVTAFREHLRSIVPQPDILCLQESSDFGMEVFHGVFGHYYRHRIKDRATSILSRFPIIATGQIDFGTRTNSCLWADVIAHLDTIRVYSAHLQSNQITKETEKLAATADLQSQETWSSIRWILAKYKNQNQKRSSQVKKLVDHINMSPYPVILSTDLNDHPQSFIYRELNNVLQDSFRKRGKGLGTTFAGSIPLLRIDYTMYSDDFNITNHQVVKPTMSDHYPVLSTASLR